MTRHSSISAKTAGTSCWFSKHRRDRIDKEDIWRDQPWKKYH
jgi:hypothetical protein